MTYRGLLAVASVLSVLFLASLMYGGDEPVTPAQPVRAAMIPLDKGPADAAPLAKLASKTPVPQPQYHDFLLAGGNLLGTFKGPFAC